MASETVVVSSLSEEQRIEIESDVLVIQPLGGGQEVGRSCILISFKGKKVLLDMGIHPGLSGMDALPFVDSIEADEIDLLLISHFHLDHCGALPWFLQKTTFKGRCFMTHATKAIYRWLLADCIKVSNISSSSDHMLYNEADLEASMDKIEVMNFHEEKDVSGIRFWGYNAGHVLGAAMFMISIAGVKVLYTGDFSRQEDRHLMSAEIPSIRPDVLMIESTYGTHIHEKREEREARFTGIVYDTVMRGGRCLIPVFALGRAQELLLILDEYWSQHPELHEYPIYYASSLAKKCLAVYQTMVHAMNERIRKQIAISNPFVFKHILNLKSVDHFEDVGPCVVLASPGMMQSGLSRDLFESWCPESRNTCIIAGYCVEGTLAKQILSEPQEITSLAGHKIPRKCQVEYLSFSAHADYLQTSEFIRVLKPPNIVLLHGEAGEMNRLKNAITREYESLENPPAIFNPKNTQSVELHFRGEKTAKVCGSLAKATLNSDGKQQKLSGLLVKRNFTYHLLHPDDLSKYTNLVTSIVSQRLNLHFAGEFQDLIEAVSKFDNQWHVLEGVGKGSKSLRVFNIISITLNTAKHVATLEWPASPVNDMYADAVVAVLIKKPPSSSSPAKPVMEKFNEAVFTESVKEMFGAQNVSYSEEVNGHVFMVEGDQVVVDSKQGKVLSCPDETTRLILNKMFTVPSARC